MGKIAYLISNATVIVILCIVLPGFCAKSGREKLSMPVFGQVNRNITAQLSNPAFLNCIVNNLRDRTVSWIRARDFHVLTVGNYRYTTDERFEVIHNEKENSWTLKIIYTNLTDIGQYECQVSSDPKISFPVTLNVVVPMSKILQGPDFYIQSGSKLTLTCQISRCFEIPKYVFWYHNDRMIAYDSTARIENSNYAEGIYHSVLHIDKSSPSNTGNYSCIPSNANPATITVHVLNGEKHAAIQGSDGNSMTVSTSNLTLTTFASLLTFVLWTILSPSVPDR